MTTFKLRIITPEGYVFQRDVESLTAPGIQGSFGVMAHHAPMISAVQTGLVKVQCDGALQWIVIGDGIVEVDREETVIMTGTAMTVPGKAEADRELQKLLDA